MTIVCVGLKAFVEIAMRRNAVGFLFALVSVLCSVPAQKNGRVVVDNRSDQFVRVLIDSHAVGGGERKGLQAWYTFEPHTSSGLLYRGKTLIASDVGYKLFTAVGSSPAAKGKVWVTGNRVEDGVLRVTITNKTLPTRNEKRAVVRAAWAVVESQTAGIMLAAHPTATDLRATYESTWRVTRNGRTLPGHFGLTYRYNWKSGLFDEQHWTRIDFLFDRNGKIYAVRAATDKPGATSSMVSPFAASSILVDLVEREILSSEEVKKDRTFGPLIRKAAANNDSRSMLKWWLRYCQQ